MSAKTERTPLENTQVKIKNLTAHKEYLQAVKQKLNLITEIRALEKELTDSGAGFVKLDSIMNNLGDE